MRRSLFALVFVATANLTTPAFEQSAPFKVGFWNLRGGQGMTPLPGHPSTINTGGGCTGDPNTQVLNAWGEGLIQGFLNSNIKSDPSVIALGLAESWESTGQCGTPTQVYSYLQWANTSHGRDGITSTSTANGVVLLAKYGFAGPEDRRQLDTSQNDVPSDTAWVVYAPVCVDEACSASVDIFVAHWYGTGPQRNTTYDSQGADTADFMDDVAASRPRILVGDLNVWNHSVPTGCTKTPEPWGLSRLSGAPSGAYTDVWSTLHPTDIQRTGGINKELACADPDGSPWKRIDYAWTRGFTPSTMILIGQPPAWGDEAASDHLGLVAAFSDNPLPPTPDIVLWASRSTVHVGDWQSVSDATAANGARMEDDDDGVPKVTTPAANPAHYFELTFNAEAGRGYHLWIRGKAQNDYFGNDSAYVQFDGSVDQSGTPRFRIGTTSAATFVLEGCDACGVSGWGWEDTTWNGIGGPSDLIYFNTTGPQTVRIQTREDGLSIDQIVLSPSQYLNAAPGMAKNDTTILPESENGSSNDVIWTNKINTVATGNTLQKTGGCDGCPDAGAVSQQQIASAGGYVEFKVPLGYRLYAGLGTTTTTNTDPALIDYAFSFWPGGTWDIRERNVYQAEGTFTATDVFRIAVENGVVTYYRNGSVVRTTPAGTFPLVFDTTIISTGGSVLAAVIGGQ